MELPSSQPRDITIFTVPAGTPSGLTNLKLGILIPSPAVDHWGIYIESADDLKTHNGLCVELDRSADGGIIARDRTRRQREEKEPQKGIKYDYTGQVTSWEDKRIIQCAKDICKDNMFGKYHVIDVNCQTLVNLLIQRIATGEPYTPKRTASHTFSAGPANKNLVGIWEADKTPAEKLRLKAETQTANQIAFNTQQPGVPAQQSFSIGRSAIGFEFDLSKANIGDHPLTLEEQRLNAYYLSNPLDGNSGPPPPQEQNSGYVESQVSYSTLDMKGRAEAFKRSTEKHFQEVFTRARGLNSLAEGLTAYDDPKISLERREEKRKHLAELNSRYLRSKREAQLKRTSQSGRLAQIKASGKWEEHPPEQLQQCLESWRLADEHDDNPEIIDKGEFPDHLNAPGSNRAWPSREM